MPRDPANNPTERMERLLIETDELSQAYDRLLAITSNHVPYSSLPRKPLMHEFIKEMERQKITYKRNKLHRNHMARARMAGREVGIPHASSMEQVHEALYRQDRAPLFDESPESPTGSLELIQKAIDRTKT